MDKIVSRLAPSPTGQLHLGNAWAFAMCWLMARSRGGSVLLRVDDLDPDRSREELVASQLEDLRWLGMDWDPAPGLPAGELFRQSARGAIYDEALGRLEAAGSLYPCFCSRRELRLLASAPHGAEGAVARRCPCAALPPAEAEEKKARKGHWALKLKADAGEVAFSDLIYGDFTAKPQDYGGDFALRRSDGVHAYQLASAVDDALMGVSLVIRGNDLLPSCARQILILEKLGFQKPAYAHLPLILDHEGERLAKRHGSLSLRSLRAAGLAPERLIGLFANWAGLRDAPHALSLRDALKIFSPDAIPRRDIRLPEGPFLP